MKKLIYLLLLSLVFFSNSAWADILELINGQKIEGTFIDRSNGSVKFEVGGITTTYNEKDVKNVVFGSSQQKAEKTTETTPASDVSNSTAPLTVPSGTRLMVRTKKPLDSSHHKAGHKFTATLEADLAVDGAPPEPEEYPIKRIASVL